MRRFLCCMLLGAVILSGCKSQSRQTSTPAAPAHNVSPSSIYPGANSDNTLDAGQTIQIYPAPQANLGANTSASGDVYPAPISSDGTAPVTGTFAPADGDEKLVRGEAFVEIETSELLMLETYPVQVKLHLQGSLPNPCHQLRVNPSKPDDQNRIQVEVYSVTEPDKMCTEVIQPFNVLVPLENLSTGHYSIYINGELLKEFDI